MKSNAFFKLQICCFISLTTFAQSFTFDPNIAGPFLNTSKSNFYGTFSTTMLDGARLFFTLADNPANGTRITIGELGSKSDRLELKAAASKNLLLGSSGRFILFNDSNSFIGFGDQFTPQNLYHFRSASSGVNSQISSTQLMKIENDNDAFLNFSIPDDKKAGIQFSKPGNLFVGSIRLTEGNAMDFRVNENNTKMRISSNGNVSIGRGTNGSLSGISLLHLNNNSTTPTKLTLSHNFPTNSQNLEISLDSLNTAGFNNLRTNGSMAFGIGNSIRMFINSIGHVGIGGNHTLPTARLHLHENISESKNTIRLTNGNSGKTAFDGLEITLNADGDVGEFTLRESGALIFSAQSTNLIQADIGSIRLGTALSFRNKTDISVSPGLQLNDLDYGNTSVIKFDQAGTVVLTGIVDGPPNGILHIYSTQAVTSLTIKNEHPDSSPSSRIITGAGGPNGDVIILGAGGATLIYDSDIDRWRIIGVNQ